MKVSVLTDNTVNKRGLIAEHGLSLFIENNGKNILFDTGQTDVFIKNAEKMKIDLSKIDFAVLSHGHYDHCGGLISLSDRDYKVYMRSECFGKRFAENNDGTMREIGIPWNTDEHKNLKLVFTEKFNELGDGIFLISQIPFTDIFEDRPIGFMREVNGEKVRDTFSDEQILIIDTIKGLCVFCGCSHPGIINCLNYVKASFPGKKIHALFAGMHMKNADLLRIKLTIKELAKMSIDYIFPLHCTGNVAACEMMKKLGKNCKLLFVGDTEEI